MRNDNTVTVNDISISVDKAIIEAVIRGYEKGIKEKLLNGEDVIINGVGKLELGYRRVRNSYGKDFAIRVKFSKNAKFGRELVKSYEDNPELFEHLKED